MLARATTIYLYSTSTTPRTYTPGAGGEATGPFTLTANQQLICSTGARITWGTTGGTSGSDYLVVMSGDRNTINGCIFDGQDRGGNSLRVTASGVSAMQNNVQRSTFTNIGGLAVHVLGSVTNLYFSQNTFSNAETGFRFVSNNAAALSSNTFNGTATTDITCGTSSPAVTGAGNRRGPGQPSCSGCASCGSF